MDRAAVTELANELRVQLEGKPVAESLAALLVLAGFVVQDILDHHPPESVARPFRDLRDFLIAHIATAFLVQDPGPLPPGLPPHDILN